MQHQYWELSTWEIQMECILWLHITHNYLHICFEYCFGTFHTTRLLFYFVVFFFFFYSIHFIGKCLQWGKLQNKWQPYALAQMNLYNIEISTKLHRTVPTLPQLEIINLWNSLQLISGFYIVISFHSMRKSTCVRFTHFIFSNTIPAVWVDGCMYLRVRSLWNDWNVT